MGSRWWSSRNWPVQPPSSGSGAGSGSPTPPCEPTFSAPAASHETWRRGETDVIILVRHGETEANAGGLLQGRSDRGLTERGRRQAAAVGGAPPRVSRRGAPVVSSPPRR